MTLGTIIKNYRNSHGMSMDKFSELSGLSKSYISMLEKNHDQRGNIIKPSIECIEKVANAIRKPFDEVFNMLDSNLKVTVNSSKHAVDYISEELSIIIEAYENASDEVQRIVQYALKVDEEIKKRKKK